MTTAETIARRERDRLTKERDVLGGVLDLLEAEGLVHYRLNSGDAIVNGRRIRLCRKGTPDVLVLWPGGRSLYTRSPAGNWLFEGCLSARSIFFELKRPLRGVLSACQKREHARLRAAGAIVLVIDDVSELQEILRRSR